MDRTSPTRRPPVRQTTASSIASSRISSPSDFDDLDIPLHREPPSLSSNNENEEHTYDGAGWTSIMTGGGYQTVPAALENPPVVTPESSPSPPPAPRRRPTRSLSRALSSRGHHAPIPEEEGADLGLLRSAASIAEEGHSPAPTYDPAMGAFDLSSVLGPSTKADEEFLKRLQDQEATGTLTGGLGEGLKTEAILTESALLDKAAPSPLVRSLTRTTKRLSRQDTVKHLAQNEANRRGEVLEVILDNPTDEAHAGIDLSAWAGPDSGYSADPGVKPMTSFSTAEARTEIFYPQPNWKPFSMRWPYLLFLIVLSLVLGGTQEALYHVSEKQALFTFHTPAEIPTSAYFAFKFLPTIIAVSYGVLWQVTDFEVKRLEAFYQLSKEGGARAAESFNIDYITYFSFLRPFRAFRCKHYAVAVSAVASVLANALVPTLSAGAILLTPDRSARMSVPDGAKEIRIHHIWSRILTVTLFVISILGTVLLYQLQTRRSGLMGDVKGIAGLASMATQSHILMDFKDMDVATHSDIHQRLKRNRYVLRNSALAPYDSLLKPVSQPTADAGWEPKNHLSENPHPLSLRLQGMLPYLAFIAVFTLLLPIFLFTSATVVTDKAPWVITALAVCIKLGWGGLETDVRMIEPYYILSRRHAPPKTLTLDYTAMPFGWVAIQGLLNRHFVVFAVGFGTVLTEILTIVVTSLANVEGRAFITASPPAPPGTRPSRRDINAGPETPRSFWVLFSFALFILAYMAVVAGVVYVRRRRVFLPRQPNTMASVLAYIHQSKMLYHFVGTAKLGNAEMAAHLEGVGKTYGLGWFRGRDGQSHCGVDEEELVSGYKFGYDYSRATKPWEEEQVNWL
ncbi:hypothetical protein B0T18DRAFT_404954 [Schizothecium vesticola]|uniref:Uncharacterized protein n=1 Tax=Schizothecium vesticola TaxID=314040 RepID=A0AA40F7B5_9PEZI|nr:hypothetical protein B0T18DRAFT_404954 [Schizothecium vesticola]